VTRALAEGADPNARDAKGRTALHHAALAGHSEVVALLLDRGARPERMVEEPEDLFAVAVVSGELARRARDARDTGSARTHYGQAASDFDEAAARLDRAAAGTSRSVTMRKIGRGTGLVALAFLQAFASAAASSAGDLAMATQAQSQARQLAQTQALRIAQKSGGGHAAYFQAYERLEPEFRAALRPPATPRVTVPSVPVVAGAKPSSGVAAFEERAARQKALAGAARKNAELCRVALPELDAGGK
jgi:ankyrin repeat protein